LCYPAAVIAPILLQRNRFFLAYIPRCQQLPFPQPLDKTLEAKIVNADTVIAVPAESTPVSAHVIVASVRSLGIVTGILQSNSMAFVKVPCVVSAVPSVFAAYNMGPALSVAVILFVHV